MIAKGQQLTVPTLVFMDDDNGVTVYVDMPYTVERIFRSGFVYLIGATGRRLKFNCELSIAYQSARAASERRRFPERYMQAPRGVIAEGRQA